MGCFGGTGGEGGGWDWVREGGRKRGWVGEGGMVEADLREEGGECLRCMAEVCRLWSGRLG